MRRSNRHRVVKRAKIARVRRLVGERRLRAIVERAMQDMANTLFGGSL